MTGYVRVSCDVIYNKKADRYFSRVASSKDIQRKLFGEETEYSILAEDIEIKITKDEKDCSFADGVLITLCRETLADDLTKPSETSYLEMIISDRLGSFVSDWF